MVSNWLARRVRSPCPRNCARNAIGAIRSLVIIVDNATLATTIIPADAEKPPINTSRASALLPLASGSAITMESALVPAGRSATPANAIGTITTDVRTR